MHIRFGLRAVESQGGKTLAVFRLAAALAEIGHRCDVVYGAGEPPPEFISLGSNCPALAGKDRGAISRAIGARSPDLVVVAEGVPELLESAMAVAPTLHHAQNHWAVCPADWRFWGQLGRPCGVRAGKKCLLIRPVLGCCGRRQSLAIAPMRDQQSVLRSLTETGLGVICISGPQAELFRDHGVPDDQISVVPNLGIRLPPDKIAKAAAAAVAAEPALGDAVAFVGRLSKTKGARLLPSLNEALAGRAPLHVYGDGYLRGELANKIPSTLRGHIDQEAVSGILSWARAVAFVSIGPEPGGIVGIDAQLYGAPVGAFDVGASADWPAAAVFPLGEIRAMADWFSDQPSLYEARDAGMISDRQNSFWSIVATQAAKHLSDFATLGCFQLGSEEPARAALASACGTPTC